MKNTLEGTKSILDDAEEHVTQLEGRVVEITQAEQIKEKRILKNEDSLRDLWDNIQHTNSCIIGVPEGEEREEGSENIMEYEIAEKLPILGKETDVQVQEAARVPSRINPQRTTSRPTVIQMAKIKDKEGILKHQGKSNKLLTREIPLGHQLPSQQKCCRPKGGAPYFKNAERKNPTPKNALPRKPAVHMWRRDQKFCRKAQLKEGSTMKPAFQEILKGLLEAVKKRPQLEIWKLRGKMSLFKQMYSKRRGSVQEGHMTEVVKPSVSPKSRWGICKAKGYMISKPLSMGEEVQGSVVKNAFEFKKSAT